MTTYFLSDFQKEAAAVCTDKCTTLDYLYPGLIAKLGGLVAIEAKTVRGDYDHLSKDEVDDMINSEIGDVYWFMAMLIQAKEPDIDFEVDQERTESDVNYTVTLTAVNMLAIMTTLYTAQNKPEGMICPSAKDLEALFMQLIGFTRTLVVNRVSEISVMEKNIAKLTDR